MSHRTQITLTDQQYALLKRESERTGTSLAELVRRAVSASCARGNDEDAARVLEATAGAWGDPGEDGAAYVERIRRPGLGHRLGL